MKNIWTYFYKNLIQKSGIYEFIRTFYNNGKYMIYELIKTIPFLQMKLVILSLLALCWTCNGMIEHIPLPGGLLDCFSRYSQKTNVVDTVGESIASFCFGQYMWQASREQGLPGFNITREVLLWIYRSYLIHPPSNIW
jgi:predicted Rdx family selenoprotein